MALDYLILYFTIYSFIGWVCEVVYCSLLQRKFVLNRGMLYGPVCPIYGFGALILIFSLKNLIPYPIVLFFAAVLLTSSLEYAASFILEYLFDTLWWDYSKHKLNINGRVCALNSTLFGILGLALMYIVNPFISKYVNQIPDLFILIISKALLFIFIADFIFTLKALIGLHDALLHIKTLTENFYTHLESLDIHEKISESNIAESFNLLREKLKQDGYSAYEKIQEQLKLIAEKNKGHILSAFPNMRQRRNNLHLKLLKYFKEKRGE